MDFQKIQLTRKFTLNVVYKNDDGDIVSVTGANLVHKDLRQALHALIPHLAIITEQREAYNRNLQQLIADRLANEGNDNIFKRMDVDWVSFGDGQSIVIGGSRILLNGGVVNMQTPTINLEDTDYKYTNELDLDLQAVKYEAECYIKERKWGVKQAEIAFEDPFDGVQPEAVAEVPKEGKKRGRKSKTAA